MTDYSVLIQNLSVLEGNLDTLIGEEASLFARALESDIPVLVANTSLSPDSNDATFGTTVESLKKEFNDMDIGLEEARIRSKEYYRELRFHIHVSTTRGHEMELVEGGGYGLDAETSEQCQGTSYHKRNRI